MNIKTLHSDSRNYSKGMGQAVANRTINRKINNKYETWEDVAFRVAKGNSLLHPQDADTEFLKMHHHLKNATLLMSGRHLQHGDETQPTRNMEVFTNCATSVMSFLEFYLLLNGCGVGRAMDDELMLIDYKNLPIVIPVINSTHRDVLSGEISTFFDKTEALSRSQNKIIHFFEVPDSREGWAKAIEKIEIMTFQKMHRDSILILDFSLVRPRGEPIKGMQNRPASRPWAFNACDRKDCRASRSFNEALESRNVCRSLSCRMRACWWCQKGSTNGNQVLER